MKTYKTIIRLIVLSLILGLASCSSDSEFTEKEIIDFKLNLKDGSVIGGVAKGEGIIGIPIEPESDLGKLKDATAKFFLSGYATVFPLPSTPQDYSKDVNFTVTADNGSTKNWIIRHFEEGFGQMRTRWYKTKDDLGLNPENASVIENTAAYYDKHIILSRTGIKINPLTGEPNGKINVTGVQTNASVNEIAPFSLTTDDKGNLIGGTLSQFGNVHIFRIYKWTQGVDKAPEQIMAFDTGGATRLMGRKLVVIGDINADAYIIGVDAGSTDGKHYRWKVTGGVVDPEINHTYVTGIDAKASVGRQIIHPLSMDADAPYYLSDSHNNGQLFYVHGSTKDEIKGPAVEPETTKWGYALLHIEPFTLKGSNYVAVLHTSGAEAGVRFFTSIYERIDDGTTVKHELVTTKTTNTANDRNPNLTGGLALQLSDDGNEVYFYSLFSNIGAACHELKKYD